MNSGPGDYASGWELDQEVLVVSYINGKATKSVWINLLDIYAGNRLSRDTLKSLANDGRLKLKGDNGYALFTMKWRMS